MGRSGGGVIQDQPVLRDLKAFQDTTNGGPVAEDAANITCLNGVFMVSETVVGFPMQVISRPPRVGTNRSSGELLRRTMSTLAMALRWVAVNELLMSFNKITKVEKPSYLVYTMYPNYGNLSYILTAYQHYP